MTALEAGKIKSDIQDHVRRYLEIHEVEAEYIAIEGDPKSSLKYTVDEQNTDLILMGGYGGSVFRKIVIGSALDTMLGYSKIPIFICR